MQVITEDQSRFSRMPLRPIDMDLKKKISCYLLFQFVVKEHTKHAYYDIRVTQSDAAKNVNLSIQLRSLSRIGLSFPLCPFHQTAQFCIE